MADFPLRRIRSVDPKPGFRLALTWDKGASSTVDLSDMISKGGVFQPLAEKSVFAAVRIGENNRVIEWPAPADEDGDPIISIDADALFEKASRQTTKNLAGSMKLLLQTVKDAGKSFTPAKT